ncbi:O-methylsterigmatocystin oxidoreductase [Trametes pubescens]|uniref:O-methylsterigmatocystin oxidoreductase n=1 Tax=Trametes pubescens TaxID=154538 RepID=A0A1M2VU03_TRAPU|nr:O-methylsterigmatocystin oxidoreductase [Trametes pubescens]
MASSWSLTSVTGTLGFWALTGAIGCSLLLLLLLLDNFAAASASTRKPPPGPRGLPVLGNALQLPTSLAEKMFHEWGKIFGDVVYFKIFRTPAIVLNSFEAARDLLDKRSAIYSDRPRLVLLMEMLRTRTLPGIPYGDQFRKRRKWMFDAAGNKQTLFGYQDIQYREVRRLLLSLSRRPDEFSEHLHLYLAGILLEITFGCPVKTLDDELVRLAERAISGMNHAGRAGSVPVDFVPILKHIPSWTPGISFKRNAMVVRRHVEEYLDTGYNAVASAMEIGTGEPCIFRSVLEQYGGEPTPAEADDIKGLAIDVYGAGVETSRGTLRTFMLVMARERDVLRKAQEELDRVVGRERLPDFRDRESLPYVNAILEEVYRWNPPLPMAVPHRVTEDDRYREYDIPAGCMMIPNVWGMSRDARCYPEPEEFRPERHLGIEVKAGEEYVLPSSFVFGFGRRSCPGQALADATIWLAIANIVALFDILQPVDEAGKENTPPANFTSAFSSVLQGLSTKTFAHPDLF